MTRLEKKNCNTFLIETISASSSEKIDKYEYVIGEKMLPSNQRQIIEQGNFPYSPLGKAFEKEIERVRYRGEEQTKAVEYHGKQLVKSNKIIRNYFYINEDSVPLEKKLMNLLKKQLLNFRI